MATTITRCRLLNENLPKPSVGAAVYFLLDGKFRIGLINSINDKQVEVHIQGQGYITTEFDWRCVDDVVSIPAHRFNPDDKLIHLRMRNGYLGFSDKDGFELIHRRMECYIDKSTAASASMYKIDIHHKNECKIDNRPVNLVGLTANEHRQIHEHKAKQGDLFC